MSKKIKKIQFSNEEDEELIEHVHGIEYLWNMQHKDYKSAHKKEKVWVDIANKLINREPDECRKRWKSIRDHYKRQKKEDLGRTGSAAKKKRASYWDRLSFLQTVEDERETFCNANPEAIASEFEQTFVDTNLNCQIEKSPHQLSDESDEIPENSRNLTLSRHQKRRNENTTILNYLKEKKEDNSQIKDCITQILKSNELDDVDLFFKSIAMSVKKLKPHLVTKTKLKVLEIISDMEQLDTLPYQTI